MLPFDTRGHSCLFQSAKQTVACCSYRSQTGSSLGHVLLKTSHFLWTSPLAKRKTPPVRAIKPHHDDYRSCYVYPCFAPQSQCPQLRPDKPHLPNEGRLRISIFFVFPLFGGGTTVRRPPRTLPEPTGEVSEGGLGERGLQQVVFLSPLRTPHPTPPHRVSLSRVSSGQGRRGRKKRGEGKEEGREGRGKRGRGRGREARRWGGRKPGGRRPGRAGEAALTGAGAGADWSAAAASLWRGCGRGPGGAGRGPCRRRGPCRPAGGGAEGAAGAGGPAFMARAGAAEPMGRGPPLPHHTPQRSPQGRAGPAMGAAPRPEGSPPRPDRPDPATGRGRKRTRAVSIAMNTYDNED